MANPPDYDDLRRTLREAEADYQRINQELALTSAATYMTSRYPGATLVWGNRQTLPTPDTLDQIWQLEAPLEDGGCYIVIAALVQDTPHRVRQFSPNVIAEAGTPDYLFWGLKELREHGQEALADILQTEWKLGRLHYLFVEVLLSEDEMHVTGLSVREFDIETNSIVDPGILAIRRRDADAIEGLRRRFSEETLRLYVEQYWRYSTWEEKYLLICLVQDNDSLLLLPIMEDALDMPNIDFGGDAAREAHAIALIHLEDDFSRFETYFYDEEQAAIAIQAWKQKRQHGNSAVKPVDDDPEKPV